MVGPIKAWQQVGSIISMLLYANLFALGPLVFHRGFGKEFLYVIGGVQVEISAHDFLEF